MTDSYERMKAQKDAMTETEAAQKLANLSKALLDDANAECRELREALATCEAWLSRWAEHVGYCQGARNCTCGLTAIRAEAQGALAEHDPDKGQSNNGEA